jgi:hypothetical protein
MAKLTDTQLIVLSKAARREDEATDVPERMNKAAAAKVGASLVVRRVMREIRAKPGNSRNKMARSRERRRLSSCSRLRAPPPPRHGDRCTGRCRLLLVGLYRLTRARIMRARVVL